jgi:hypothetical protein
MDPNEALSNLRAAAERVNASLDAEQPVDEDDARELADAAQALDGWLSRGGFLPDGWKR